MNSTLSHIADLLKTLPHSRVTVSLSTKSREAFDFIASQPGDTVSRTTIYADPAMVIVSARTRINGVDFEASYSRDPTEKEAARLHDAVEIAPAMRAVMVKP